MNHLHVSASTYSSDVCLIAYMYYALPACISCTNYLQTTTCIHEHVCSLAEIYLCISDTLSIKVNINVYEICKVFNAWWMLLIFMII